MAAIRLINVTAAALRGRLFQPALSWTNTSSGVSIIGSTVKFIVWPHTTYLAHSTSASDAFIALVSSVTSDAENTSAALSVAEVTIPGTKCPHHSFPKYASDLSSFGPGPNQSMLAEPDIRTFSRYAVRAGRDVLASLTASLTQL
jgi:hypothetical protein